MWHGRLVWYHRQIEAVLTSTTDISLSIAEKTYIVISKDDSDKMMMLVVITILVGWKVVTMTMRMMIIRDESFITSWGGRLYWGGVGNFFGDVLGGLKIKWPVGRGGHVFRQVLGGSDVFHWSFFSLKVIASGGRSPPDPPTYIQAL